LLPQSEREARAVNLETVDDEGCQALLACFERAGVAVGIWEITSDVGVPAFRVVIMDRELNPQRPLRPNVGTGCHPTRHVALSRALTEAAQSRLTLISSSRDDLPRERYTEAADFDRLQRLRSNALPCLPQRSFHDAPTFEADEIERDLLWQKEQLAARGFEHLLVVDLTKPELGIPVARVIVPGLEPSREVPGWVPGKRARAALKSRAA